MSTKLKPTLKIVLLISTFLTSPTAQFLKLLKIYYISLVGFRNGKRLNGYLVRIVLPKTS